MDPKKLHQHSLNICKILIDNKPDIPGHIIPKNRGAELAHKLKINFLKLMQKTTQYPRSFLSLIEDVSKKHMPIRDSIRISRNRKSYKCCHKG